MPGTNAVASSGMLRSSSSFSIASAVAAAVASALFEFRDTLIAPIARPSRAPPTSAMAPRASSMEKARTPRALLDRRVSEYIGRHHFGSDAGHRDRNRDVGRQHSAAVEDRTRRGRRTDRDFV